MKPAPLVILVVLAVGTGLAAEHAPGRLHAFSWSAVPADCRHITPTVWIKKDSDPVEIAKLSLERPEGHRALFSWDLHHGLLDNPDDRCRTAAGELAPHLGVWPEHGVEAVRARFDDFFRRFKDAGGQADLMILDFEGGFSNWHMDSKTREERCLAIQNDPRFPGLAKKLGFSDMRTVANFRSGRNYLKWNAVTAGLVDDALNRAVFAPVRKHFPAIECSNYGSYVTTEPNAYPDLHGHNQWRDGIPMGTHQSRSFYTSIGQLAAVKLDGMNPFGQSPFAGLLLSINGLRAMMRSSAVPIQPWIAWQRYMGEPGRPSTVGNTPYYRELVIHLALHGVEEFLFWNPHPWRKDQRPESLSMPKDEKLLDDILTDLNQRLSIAGRKPVTTEAIAWDTRVIASGLQVADRVVWRFTFSPEARELKATLDGQPVTIGPADGEVGTWFSHPVATLIRFD